MREEKAMRKEKLMRLVKAEIEQRCDEFEQLDRRADETCFDRDTLIRLADRDTWGCGRRPASNRV
jgi:hypothetical protein